MRKFRQGMLVVAGVLALPGVALADGCPQGYVCASDPAAVVASLQAQGYKAKLTKDDDGKPEIDSATGGYDYYIYFKDCDKDAKCASLEFSASFVKQPEYTLGYVNAWNNSKRYSTMSLLDDGGILITYDVSTTGGLDQPNFADVVDWWTSTIGGLDAFRTAHPAPAAASAPAHAAAPKPPA